MTTHIPTTRRRLAVAGVASLLLLPASAAAADGAPTATAEGAKAGYENVYEGENATIETFKVEGGDIVEALCIEFGTALDRSATFTAIPRSEADISRIGQAAWVGANHTKVGTPLDDEHLEATAVQLAAWTFTDSL
jgi:hypothetical protein